ncbi:DUF1572 domain-containing protein [Paenibacillus sp. N3/727]|uniref:DUF1572 family protein n=1 Tax=Paenibacillus sp. N3/727 TaxID=2925845 RepID=UPI001F53C5D8|nr:DUF1572 family protein [Paenibacillus sp. N3/727]UNK16900.1 DUF1572 domain-containing protein [Paenibacillus sp. N3/727]
MIPDPSHSLEEHYLHVVIEKFLELKQSAERTFEQLNSDDWNWSYNADSNSIAVIVKHMSGNMISRWTDFLTTNGEKPNRNRDEEFENELMSEEMLLEVWNRGWEVFLNTLRTLAPQDLLSTVFIREQPHSVMEAIERQMSHYSYHVGQIVYVAKLRKSDDWKSLTIPRKK